MCAIVSGKRLRPAVPRVRSALPRYGASGRGGCRLIETNLPDLLRYLRL
jgi:hypothetical protein